MSTDESTPAPLEETTVSGTLASLFEAYDHLDMPVGRYLLTVVAPALVVFVLSVVAATSLPLPGIVRPPVALLGLLMVVAALGYPKYVVSHERTEMEDKFHLMVTHMTVLSTTNIDRMEVFRTLAREEEYGALATEISRITQLVDTWNQSLDDACRRRATAIPSKPLSDFFERLAYTLGAGQELSDFLLSEQEVMMTNYVTVYESALNNLEVMKDLYMSMVLSMTFALVFATVLPILSGTDPTTTVSAVIVLYVFIQAGFFLAIRTMAPYDPVWYLPEEESARTDRRLVASMVAGGVLTGLLVLVTGLGRYGVIPFGLDDLVLFVDPLPGPLYLCVPLTPLLIPGVVFRIEENRIAERDEEFPSFIRALGSSESAKQSTTSAVLEDLRRKDFGALTRDIDNLYKRLNMRLDTPGAWRHFTAETRSYLIQKFSEMYLIGRQMGGEPKQLGELISESMDEVNQLRQRRQQATVTLIGLLYGITAASSFAFFIGLQVVAILSGMSLDLGSSGQFDFGTLLHTSVYDIPTIQFLLLLVILFNALLSSLMIRAVDGGHKANAYIHFVVMTWLGCLIAVATKAAVSTIIGV